MRKKIYNHLRKMRAKKIAPFVWFNQVYDIGSRDGFLGKYLSQEKDYKYFDIIKPDPHFQNVEQLTFKSKSVECIICTEVLEHVRDPVKAIKELNRVYKNLLIITVPKEPMFSILRGGWDKEHLWAITPKLLKMHLGTPAHEETFMFRYYMGVWRR